MSSNQSNQFFLPGITYDDFIDKDIIDLLKLNDAPQEEKDKMIDKIMDTIQTRVISRIIETLSDEEATKVEEYLDQNNEDAFFALIQEKKINLTQMYAEEALVYKAELLDLVYASDDNSDSKEE